MKFQTLIEEINSRKKALDLTLQRAQDAGLDKLADQIDAIPALREKVNIQADTYSFDLQIAGNKQDLEAVWALLRRAGFECKGKRPEKNTTSWSGWFRKDGFEGSVYLSFHSTVCRRVQVGTKMEEVPVYEVNCGEEVPSHE